MKRYLRSSQNDKPDNNYLVHLLSHKILVSKYGNIITTDMMNRFAMHDDTKLYGMEKELFANSGAVNEDDTYLDSEYISNIENGEISVALARHYGSNDHHPEHHTNGIDDMDLVQLIEMLIDWKVGGLSYKEGDIYESIDKNINRFGIDEQLSTILRNTAKKYLEDDFEWEKE